MIRQGDREYYAARAAVERELSQTAPHPLAAEVHAKLAEGYERLTAVKPGSRPELRLVTS